MKAYHSTTQSVSDNSTTALSMDSEDFDTDGFHSTSSNTSRLTIPAGMGGKYLVVGHTTIPPVNTTGRRVAVIQKNGAEVTGGAQEGVPNATTYNIFSVSMVLILVAGDYIEFCAYQTSGGSLNVGTTGSAATRSSVALYKIESGALGSPPGASVSGTSTALSTGAYTSLAFASADTFDTDGFHDPASNNTRLTIPVGLGGKYLFTGYTTFPNSTTSSVDKRLAYRVTGGTDVLMNRSLTTTGVGTVDFMPLGGVTLDLAAGDYVELRQYANNASQTTTSYSAQLMRLGGSPVVGQSQGTAFPSGPATERPLFPDRSRPGVLLRRDTLADGK